MKAFNIIGVIVVAAWLVFSGLYIYRVQSAPAGDEQYSNPQFKMLPGESWLVLRRLDKDAGFIHQKRTRVADGWFFEQDLYIGLELSEQVYIFGGTMRIRLDDAGQLIKFTGELSSEEQMFRVEGHMRQGRLELTQRDENDVESAETIELDEPPRLTLTLGHQLMAGERPSPNSDLALDLFDPFAMKMRAFSIEYQGEREVDVYEEYHDSDHFIDKGGEVKYDHYLNPRGEALIQSFPFRLVGAQVRGALGRSRSTAIRRQLKERKKQLEPEGPAPPPALELGEALDILGGHKPWAGEGSAEPGARDEDQRPDASENSDDQQPQMPSSPPRIAP